MDGGSFNDLYRKFNSCMEEFFKEYFGSKDSYTIKTVSGIMGEPGSMNRVASVVTPEKNVFKAE